MDLGRLGLSEKFEPRRPARGLAGLPGAGGALRSEYPGTRGPGWRGRGPRQVGWMGGLERSARPEIAPLPPPPVTVEVKKAL